MKNRDIANQELSQIREKMQTAIEANNAEEVSAAFMEMITNIENNIRADFEEVGQERDTTVLASRGVRQLTGDEKSYYNSLIEACKSANPQQAITDITVALPSTVIDAVFEDLTESHPLLDAINFQNTSGLVEILISEGEVQLAQWGDLTDTIVKEVTAGFRKINLTLKKLSAFLPISKAMLDLGPEWLDRYVRALLAEAIFTGLEDGIINGTGNKMPIGMKKQVGEGVTVTGGVYPDKEAVAVTGFDAVTYGELASRLAKNPDGKTRSVGEPILIVNPVDYLKKIMPATTIRNANGEYINGVLPIPTKIVESSRIAEGSAILGIQRKYFMGIGTGKEGKIEYSDEAKFLEDVRVYLTKLYGYGEPMDNNAFLLLDITNLVPVNQKVEVVGTVATKEQP